MLRCSPEFEIPGHALGFLPIASPESGLEFCSTCAYPDGCQPSQLWGTEGTAKVVTEIMGEMAALCECDAAVAYLSLWNYGTAVLRWL
jgi:hypothetical protein